MLKIRTVRLEIHFEDERYEDFICIFPPSDGLYALKIVTEYENYYYPTIAVYFFDDT